MKTEKEERGKKRKKKEREITKAWNQDRCKYRYNESHPGQAIYHACNYKCNSVIRPGGTSFFNGHFNFAF